MSVLHIVVRNPSGAVEDQEVQVDASSPVLRLKGVLSERYPGQPPPQHQKIIHGGRLLRDAQLLSEALGAQGRFVVHLVVPAQYAPNANRFRPQHNTQLDQQQQPAPPPPQLRVPAPRAPPAAQGGGGWGNFGLLFRLAVVVVLLSQGGSTSRVFLLLTAAFVVYLYQAGMLSFVRLPRANARRVRLVQPQDGEQEPRVEEVPQEEPSLAARVYGEAYDLVVPFVLSLLPAWNTHEYLNPAPVVVQE